MNPFREDAEVQLGEMARARFNARDAREVKNTKRFCASVADFTTALQEFVSSLHLAEVLR